MTVEARPTYARQALEAFTVLHAHLADDGKPLMNDDGVLDSSYYLTPAEWDEVRVAAAALAGYAAHVAESGERKASW